MSGACAAAGPSREQGQGQEERHQVHASHQSSPNRERNSASDRFKAEIGTTPGLGLWAALASLSSKASRSSGDRARAAGTPAAWVRVRSSISTRTASRAGPEEDGLLLRIPTRWRLPPRGLGSPPAQAAARTAGELARPHSPPRYWRQGNGAPVVLRSAASIPATPVEWPQGRKQLLRAGREPHFMARQVPPPTARPAWPTRSDTGTWLCIRRDLAGPRRSEE